MTCPRDRDRVSRERNDRLRLEAYRLNAEADPAEIARLVARGLTIVGRLLDAPHPDSAAPIP